MSGRVVSPLLVGRDAELSRLVATVMRAPAVAVVEGEAGIGKTRLVAEMAARPELRGRRVLNVACRRIREPFPLGPIVEALRDAGPALSGAGLSRVAGALRPLLPELEDVLPPGPRPLDDRAAERHRVFRALTEVFGALGESVLIVEDTHWADEQTLEFLDYLLAAPPPGLSLVVTYRGEEAGQPLRAAIARPAATVTRERLELAPLDVPQTRALAQAILGAERISEELAAFLCERGSGLPMAIQELLALLRERGALAWRHGRWARRAVEDLDVPTQVRDSVLERVARLSPGARAVVEAAAVLAVDVPEPVLVAVSRGGDPDGLDEAVRAGMIDERAGRFGFRHVLAAQAVYADIPGARRRGLHGRAAEAVRGLTPTPLGGLAHHLREAGRLDEWVDAAERAADQAIELRDDAEAMRLLEDVLRNADLDPLRRAELTIKMVWASYQVLHVPDLREVITRALDADLPRAIRGELRFLLGLHLDDTGAEPELKRKALAESADDLSDRPALVAWAMLGLGSPAEDSSFAPRERALLLDRAMATVPDIADEAQRQLMTGKVAMAWALTGDARWRELAGRLATTTVADSRIANAYRSVGLAACYVGHHDVARQALGTARDLCAELDGSGALAFKSRVVWLMLAYLRGEWDGLAAAVPETLDGLRDRSERLVADQVSLCLRLAAGDLDGLPARMRALTESSLPVDPIILPVNVTILLRLAVAGGEAEPALDVAARCREVWESRGMWPLGVRALPALVEATIAVSRPEEADALVELYAARLDGLDAPLGPCVLPHARGLLAGAAGRWTEAAALLAEAAGEYELLPAPYEAAQARERAAEALRAAGDPGATAMLAASVAAYERLGARWDLDRAGRTARQWGVEIVSRPAARRGPRGYGDELSPRERKVAELVATGMTNRDIGRELFVSPKTVEKHLASALRKLGLRSRAALAAHLGAETAEASETAD